MHLPVFSLIYLPEVKQFFFLLKNKPFIILKIQIMNM